MGKETIQGEGLREMPLQGPLWVQLMSSLLLLGTSSHLSRVMSVTRRSADDSNSEPKRARVEIQSALSFSVEEKIGTIQPHDVDTLFCNPHLTSYRG